ncbi:HepT-like ribonuclease domain-containing protein [Microcoleus sp. FACHB-672]|uniref:HepT-like ribonuclease domain-containing protein n=1 Tax=Microcoleus sp. FACHB-672 TaxID=2692825 RepID=UPI003A5C578B
MIEETVKNISKSLRSKYPKIQWKIRAEMREKLIHEYWKTENFLTPRKKKIYLNFLVAGAIV